MSNNIEKEYFGNGNIKKEILKDIGIVRYYNINGDITREISIEDDEKVALKPYKGNLNDLPKFF